MIMTMFKLFSVSGNTENYQHATDFYQVFEDGFRGLDNLPLTKQQELAAQKNNQTRDPGKAAKITKPS